MFLYLFQKHINIKNKTYINYMNKHIKLLIEKEPSWYKC